MANSIAALVQQLNPTFQQPAGLDHKLVEQARAALATRGNQQSELLAAIRDLTTAIRELTVAVQQQQGS